MIKICIPSYPARGMWIEITSPLASASRSASYPARGMWIEIPVIPSTPTLNLSYPARGMWIEIIMRSMKAIRHNVIPREGYGD